MAKLKEVQMKQEIEIREVVLTEKQLSIMGQIQQMKAQVKAKFDELNVQESNILELVLDNAGIPTPVESIEFKEGKLIVKMK